MNINEMLKGMGKVIKGEFPIKLFYEATAPLHPGQYDLVQSIGLQCSFFFSFFNSLNVNKCDKFICLEAVHPVILRPFL